MRGASPRCPIRFAMWRGGELHGARVAYETWGELNAARTTPSCCSPASRRRRMRRLRRQDPSEGWWEGMIGPGLAIDTEPLLRHLREFARQLLRLHRARVDRSRHRRAVSHELSGAVGRGHRARRLRNAALARHRARGHRHRPLARRHGGARVRRAVSRRRAPRDQHFRHGGRFAVRDRASLDPARSDPARSGLASKAAYTDERPPATGMRIARKLGMMTYRSAHRMGAALRPRAGAG